VTTGPLPRAGVRQEMHRPDHKKGEKDSHHPAANPTGIFFSANTTKGSLKLLAHPPPPQSTPYLWQRTRATWASQVYTHPQPDSWHTTKFMI